MILDNQRKGFNGSIQYDSQSGEQITEWLVYNLAFNDNLLEKIYTSLETDFWLELDDTDLKLITQPAFYLFSFKATVPTDQFINFQVNEI